MPCLCDSGSEYKHCHGA
ncbi:SEC-C metal-binding domain-containing protein [Xanthomonas hortorum]|uniref:SEC-C metal-binding domain-containing protein n=1 Tax=Xanthomonas hortorum pv. vitians TaxID=83224 RepID=A0AAW8ZVA3_9XANT|nr:SEC-C metal-binding domain-containing protein [Xanthomonas hortorum]MDV7251090.1 SEC-C metal-binding domain-containing protein [Xanthomonas hortorum pv. vitians]